MPRDSSMIGHNSGLIPLTDEERKIIENRDTSNQVIIQAYKRLLECVHQIPAKFLTAVICNEKNFSCCRIIENLSMEVRKTQDKREIQEPDLYVIKCDCGREHIRLMAAPGHLGNPDKTPKFVLNPLFKGAENAEKTA